MARRRARAARAAEKGLDDDSAQWQLLDSCCACQCQAEPRMSPARTLLHLWHGQCSGAGPLFLLKRVTLPPASVARPVAA